MPLASDNTPNKPGFGILSFSCPESVIKQVESAAEVKGLTVSEYLTRLIQEFFFKNESLTVSQEFPEPSGNHPLIRAVYKNRQKLGSQQKAYEFFEKEFPEVIEKMQLTAILMRKTEFNEFVIQDLIASLIPEPFNPVALQAILDVYQITAQKLDQTIQAADTLKNEQNLNAFRRES